MNHNNWLDETESILRESVSDLKERDVIFYRLEELWRNIQRMDEYSSSCKECQRLKEETREVVEGIDEAIHKVGKERKMLDGFTSTLSEHIQSDHGFRPAYFYSYRYSFFGLFSGAVSGMVLDYVLPIGGDWFFTVLFLVLGLLAGHVKGSIRDQKIRRDNKIL